MTGRKKLAIVLGVSLAAAAIAGLVIGLVLGLESDDVKSPIGDERLRIDCVGEAEGGVVKVTPELCASRGCIYHPSGVTLPRSPACFMPQDDSTGYRVVRGPETTTLGQRWYLERKVTLGVYAENLPRITFDFENRGDNVIRFKFDSTDDAKRFKVPLSMNLASTLGTQPQYSLEVYSNDPFYFRVIRQSSKTVLWDTGVGGLVFADQFLQIATRLPSVNVYGFGENVHHSLRHDMNYKTWPMFARDQPSVGDDVNATRNLYGVHPFYECVENDGQTHGVLLLNSNAMDYTLTPAPGLIYKTTGGVLDFYMFLGSTPESVTQQYTQAIGLPYMPPYWSLGFQLCRYGYMNISMMQQAVSRTLDYDIPLDVVYADIDHMYKQRDFTIDPVNFAGLSEYFDDLHTLNMKTIIILDPALEINDTYDPYVRGRDDDIYIKWPSVSAMPPADYNETGRLDMIGYVWPEWKVVFPDFFHANASRVWTELIVNHHQELVFDGLWIDMNEPANFGTNEERPWNWPVDRLPYWSLKCPPSAWDTPPYRPKSAYTWDDRVANVTKLLSDKTLCMVGSQGSGAYRHYDVHNLYGWSQTPPTLRAVREAVGPGHRSIVISRSTFPGSGHTGGHWLGDNSATWADLRLSIIGSLEFNLFGIPYIGADICGFFGDSNAQLCKRWQELGAFYTYSRNHNTMGALPQDPGYFGDDVALASRRALLIRYTLLPYLYTLFHLSHIRGSTVMRPLYHEFPKDAACLSIDRQLLWGSALLISPILEENATSVIFYLPPSRWYDYHTGVASSRAGGFWTEVPVTENSTIPLHIRGGHILPTQEPANSTFYSRLNDFGLLVALDEVDIGHAEGELFWDDGESIDTYENDRYFYAKYNILSNSKQLTITVTHLDDATRVEMDSLVLNTITIMGVSAASNVTVNGQSHSDFTINTATQVLEINDLGLPMIEDATLTWV